ncbi:MAG: hypothetical protein EBR30_28765 [Cytophagia bacterium]|nr:hypothetical protein [Cytophagia bacterium]
MGSAELHFMMNRFDNYQGTGDPGYFMEVVDSLRFLFLFTISTIAITLSCFLFFKNKMDRILIRNIYISLIYLFLLLVLIEIG